MLDFDVESLVSSPRVIPGVEFAAEEGTSFSRSVYLVNDDYTPMEFVIDTLMCVFKHDLDHAERVTMKAHYDGRALCGEYPKDIAETMACNAIELARSQGHPLLFMTEKQ
ncbi:MAG: ATP-dependent Clp protease adaptor ClpS [Francisellaceae bacterium]